MEGAESSPWMMDNYIRRIDMHASTDNSLNNPLKAGPFKLGSSQALMGTNRRETQPGGSLAYADDIRM
jgi:hypothetical protein